MPWIFLLVALTFAVTPFAGAQTGPTAACDKLSVPYAGGPSTQARCDLTGFAPNEQIQGAEVPPNPGFTFTPFNVGADGTGFATFFSHAGDTPGPVTIALTGQTSHLSVTLHFIITPGLRAVTVSGFVVDGLGGLNAFGAPLPNAVIGAPYWPRWDIARGAALTASNAGGFVLDGWGGLHPFTQTGGPAAPSASGAPYWRGWDIARGVALLPNGTGGFVLDGWGGLHPFGVNGQAAPTVTAGTGPYWRGWDIARGVALLPSGTGGYVLDALGGVHPFGVNGSAAAAAAVFAPYWPAWNIARGIAVIHDGTGGFVVDGYGALHGFDIGTGQTTVPQNPGNGPYWPNRDIARGITVVP
jgi:hypothetical protein